MLKQESKYFRTFLYGTPEEKIAALDWLEKNISWDAKRWVQGLVYDQSPLVRARAAQYIANSEFTYYLPDLRGALKNEQDSVAKTALQNAIDFLNGI